MPHAADCDLVVLGSGIAGLSAALAAHENGLRPLVIEKSPKVGGGTINSYGLIWVGNNHLARSAGYQDSRDEVARYMTFVAGGEALAENLAAYVDIAPEALRFFESCGIPFRIVRGLADHYYGVAPGGRAEGRSVEADLISGHALGDWRHRVHVPPVQPCYLTAEEQIAWGGINRFSQWDQALVRERQANDMRGKGLGLICHFLKALVDREVPIMTGETVQRLLRDGDRISGVVTGGGEEIKARAGVMLATGGYESNPELVHAFENLPGWLSQCPPTVTGDGLVLASEAGAALHMIRNNMALFLGFDDPLDEAGAEPAFHLAGIIELCSPHTMVVNRRGQRFGDEAYFQGLIPSLRLFDPLTHDYPNLPCFLIFDQQYATAYSCAGRPAGAPVPQWVARASDIRELGKMLGIDPDGLSQTVERFNAFASAGCDGDFRRGELAWRLAKREMPDGTNPTLGRIEQPPFYGIELHPSGCSSAGVLSNAHGQVMHQRRRPIEGLYVSGNTAARVEFGAGYQAGYTLASAMTFSYLAVERMRSELD
jgi:3-oxosteroid 1-dehydrogenase